MDRMGNDIIEYYEGPRFGLLLKKRFLRPARYVLAHEAMFEQYESYMLVETFTELVPLTPNRLKNPMMYVVLEEFLKHFSNTVGEDGKFRLIQNGKYIILEYQESENWVAVGTRHVTNPEVVRAINAINSINNRN